MARRGSISAILHRIAARAAAALSSGALLAQPSPTPLPCLGNSQQVFSSSTSVQIYTVPRACHAAISGTLPRRCVPR